MFVHVYIRTLGQMDIFVNKYSYSIPFNSIDILFDYFLATGHFTVVSGISIITTRRSYVHNMQHKHCIRVYEMRIITGRSGITTSSHTKHQK